MIRASPRLVAALAWLYFAGALAAANEDYRNLTIAGIGFVPERQPLQPEQLSKLLPFKIGDKLDPAALRLAIERMHSTGRYLEIAVEAERQGEGVALKFVTKGTWFIGRVSTDGVHDPPNRGQLVSASKLHLGDEFNTGDLQAASTNLKAKLEANGFFEARIDPAIAYDESRQQANIDFHIDPGPRAKFNPPIVQGVTPEEAQRLIGQTRWKYPGGFLGWKPVQETRVQRGIERIRRSLAKQDYHLVFMDCQMPIMDGFAAASEIRRREGDQRRTRIVALTANAMSGDRERCLAAGMDDYVSKPIRTADLEAALKRSDQRAVAAPPARQDLSTVEVDNDALAALVTATDRETLRAVVEMLKEDVPRSLSDLRAALASADAVALSRTAHRLKGSSGTLGLRRVQALCQGLEEDARAKRLSEAGARIDALEQALRTAVPLLASHPLIYAG